MKILIVLALLGVSLAFAGGAGAQDGDRVGPLPVDEVAPPEPAPVAAAPQADPALTGVLPEATPGDEALAALDAATLADIAAQNGTSAAELTAVLADDSSVWLDEDGLLMYFDPPAPAEFLEGAPPQPGPFPNSQTFLLHSKPGSSKVLYLDFDGYALPAGTGWNGGAALNALPWDTDGNGANWSQSEHDTIQSVWQRVSEDYAPFDVDVTTEDPGFAAIHRTDAADTNYGTRVVITDTPNATLCTSGCGGVAYGGVFDTYGGLGHDYYQPAWSFADGVGDGAHNLAEVSSHEAGHNVGLAHDGQSPSTAYYAGHGMWAPIMGNSYGQPVTQWSKGEYAGANNTQDDFVVMQSNGLALIADDADCFLPTNDILSVGAQNLINPGENCDTWRFTAQCTGSYTILATPDPYVSPNVSLYMDLYEANPVSYLAGSGFVQPVRVNGDLATGMEEQIVVNLTRGVDYIVAIFPMANGTASTGWTNYANVGRYEVVPFAPGNNDLFSCAGTIGGPSDTQTGSNAGYGAPEAGEPEPTCDFGSPTGPTAWWSWTAPNSSPVTIDTYGSDFDTVLAVYTGTAVNALTEVVCNDQALGTNQSEVNFTPVAGTTYWIQVDGYFGATGNITLNTRPAPVVTPGAIGGPEGDTGTTNFPVPVRLDRASNDPITLPYVTFGGGCGVGTPGVDYTALNSTITIPAGVTEVAVNVPVFGDTTPEPNAFLGEWIPLAFGTPTTGNATLNPGFFGLGVAIVGNDDGPPPPCP